MGHRVAPYICQRVTDALRYIHEHIGYFLLNYIDDFVGAEVLGIAQKSYETFGRLLSSLGVQEAESKAIPPTHQLEFLGVGFDTIQGIIFMTQDRLQELDEELSKWFVGRRFSRKDLEWLIGKLQFVMSCVRPGRVFIARLLNKLCGLGKGSYAADSEMIKDVNWWRIFLPCYNGVLIMWPECHMEPDQVVASDACLSGLGGMMGGEEYFHLKLPQEWAGKNVAYLEMWDIVVCLKVWGSKLRGKRVVMNCDNEAVVAVLNHGRSRDAFLQGALHEVVFLLATYEVEIKAKFLRGVDNHLPDLLSRWAEPGGYRKRFRCKIRDESWKRVKPSVELLQFTHVW